MKNIAKPFAESNYAKMTKLATTHELNLRNIEDLKFIRDRIAAGQMTAELYDFLNIDGSISRILPYLPRPVDSVSCEALTSSQLSMIDEVIAKEELQTMTILQKIWLALKDWLMDYIDRNRINLRELRYIRALWRSNATKLFGTPSQFGSTNVTMYRRNEFDTLINAAGSACELLKHVPSKPDEIESWINVKTPLFNNYFGEFGKFIDESGNVISGSAKFIRMNGACAGLGWVYNDMSYVIDNVIRLMDNEIDTRRQIDELERLFKSANGGKYSASFAKLRKIVIASKTCSLTCGRLFNAFLSQIQRARVAQSYKR